MVYAGIHAAKNPSVPPWDKWSTGGSAVFAEFVYLKAEVPATVEGNLQRQKRLYLTSEFLEKPTGRTTRPELREWAFLRSLESNGYQNRRSANRRRNCGRRDALKGGSLTVGAG